MKRKYTKKAKTPIEVDNMDNTEATIEPVKHEAQARPDPSNRAGRPRRSSAGGANGRNVLGVSGELDPNYVYRTVNDTGSRVDELKSFGYDIVQGDEVGYSSSNNISGGSAHTVVVDKRTGMKGILMRQPKEYNDEDKELKKQAIDKTEESMFRKLKTEDGRYGEIEQTDSLARKNDE